MLNVWTKAFVLKNIDFFYSVTIQIKDFFVVAFLLFVSWESCQPCHLPIFPGNVTWCPCQAPREWRLSMTIKVMPTSPSRRWSRQMKACTTASPCRVLDGSNVLPGCRSKVRGHIGRNYWNYRSLNWNYGSIVVVWYIGLSMYKVYIQDEFSCYSEVR